MKPQIWALFQNALLCYCTLCTDSAPMLSRVTKTYVQITYVLVQVRSSIARLDSDTNSKFVCVKKNVCPRYS